MKNFAAVAGVAPIEMSPEAAVENYLIQECLYVWEDKEIVLMVHKAKAIRKRYCGHACQPPPEFPQKGYALPVSSL